MSQPDAPSPATRGTYDAVAPSVFDADPALGLDTDPRGGRETYPHRDAHSSGRQDGHSQTAASYVRPARESDLEAIGTVHATVMRASLDAAHTATHARPLPAATAALMDPGILAAGWHDAVTAPPSASHRVLVAVEHGQVIGLVALAPTQGRAVAVDADGAATHTGVPAETEPESGVEILALGVAPAHQRTGHGSRLLAAATDTARNVGATTLVAWAVRGDDSIAGLLESAGLERTRSHRELPVGDGVTEDCWAAAL